MLSNGTLNTDYKGLLAVGDGTVIPGEVFRFHAWGRTTNTAMMNGTARVKLYFNPNAALNNPIADSGANRPQLTMGISNTEWHFFAQVTIRTTGANGTAWCDSLFENVEDLANYNKMCGSGTFNFDSTVTNSYELTVEVTTNGSLTLDQCSVERLIGPAA